MKEIISDKLIILATAQDRLAEVTAKLEQMENSVETLEKSSFELLNNSDKIVSMSKEGMLLADRLKELLSDTGSDTVLAREVLIHITDEIRVNLHNIYNLSKDNNRLAHDGEKEAVCQRDYKDFINDSISVFSNSISSAVACAELLLAET